MTIKKAAHLAADSLEALQSIPAINRISECAWEADRHVPAVNGAELTEFDQFFAEPPPLKELLAHMPPVARRRWEMIAFCLRYAGGVETRSFAEAGKELGCSAVAVFKTYRMVLGAVRALAIYDGALGAVSCAGKNYFPPGSNFAAGSTEANAA